MRQNQLGKLIVGKYRMIFYLSMVILVVGYFFILKKNQLDLQNKTSVEISDYIIGKMSACHENDDTSKCYQANAEDFINRFELNNIMTVFDQNEKTPEFFDKCHRTAHFLGQTAYKKYGSIAAVFSQTNGVCLGGVYHGAVEGYFMAQGTTDIKDTKVRQQINSVCGTPKDYVEPQKFIECNHGLGHAVMYLTKNDLPEALDMCEALSSKNERSLCYTGALMANADSFGSTDHPTKYIKEDDPLYPCSILKKEQQEMCYTYGVLSRFQFDLAKSISVCSSVPGEFKNQCFGTLGRDRTIISSDPLELKSQCYQIKKEEFRKDCISGTSYNLVIRFGANSDIPASYCSITDAMYKDNCYNRIFGALGNITKDQAVVKKFCEKISDESYKNKCLNSI